MPPAPAFDYYETLGIGKSATIEEIKSSYRRLAMVHHPDRNPDNIDESTAAFQRIQIAHETLSNERSRAIYDARSSRRSTFDDDEYCNEEDVDFNDFMHDFSREPFGSYGGGPSSRFFFDGQRFAFYYPSGMDPDEAWKRDQEEQEAAKAAARRKQMVNEVRRRREAEEARVKAREAARAAEEREQILAKERRAQAEKARQEALWAQSKATTQAEKQGSCLHSEFCAKEKSQKKFKCTSCGQKRGMVGHRCPHCSLLICQVCLNGIRQSP